MITAPEPKPTILPRVGPHLLSPVERFVGLEIAKGGRLPARLHFVLRDGSALFLPAERAVLRQLLAILAEHLGNHVSPKLSDIDI